MSADYMLLGSLASHYDEHLGPILFEPYAEELAASLPELRSGTLLEIAAGTGILTRALDRTLPPSVDIVATDISRHMLAYGASKCASRRTWWQYADATALPFRDSTFDRVVCQFGVMFFPDKPAAFKELRRIMKRGGCLTFSTWHRIENCTLSHIEEAAMALCLGSPAREDFLKFGIPLQDAIKVVNRALVSRFGEGRVVAPMEAHVITAGIHQGPSPTLCQPARDR